ncbi:helix-turn-helix domain-containing protein [Paenibacillus sp. J2TS4]|uniref:helix-turn-helix domain-containing protein n=1 Tax=Paenibacillus sp. J2TS4 TaxID=2807194 RepID=UPI001B13BA25|nr:helix-turn-helix domain-containing protein [Paenibacillus sp. J2TS4]GIP31233.1 putative HTH-type transcriptional regulator YtdP [Paenibacillus sp. J2TS4]
MKSPHPKFLLKLLVFTLFIGTFPVIFLGIFSYSKVSGTIQKNVQESNNQILMQMQSKVEQMLRMADYSAFQYMNVPLVMEALSMDLRARDMDIINELILLMNQMQTFELGVREIQFVNLNKLWMIDNNGLSRFSELPEPMAGYLQSSQPSFWMNFDNEVKLVKKIPVYSPNPSGLLILTIPVYELERQIGDNRTLSSVMILDLDGRIMAGQDRSLIGAIFSGLSYGTDVSLLASDEGYYQEQRKGVTYRKSAYNGWTYLSVTSIHDITRQSREIGWFTIYLCGGILLLAFAISYMGSKKMYSPIQRLYQSVVGDPHAVHQEARRDELELIGDRFHGLISKQSQLFQQLQGQSRHLQEYFMLKLVQNEFDTNEIQEKFNRFGHAFSWKRLCVLTLQIDSFKDSKFLEKDRDLLMFAVNNMVTELVPADQRLLPIVLDQSQVTVIGDNSENKSLFKKMVDKTVLNIQQEVKKYLGLKVSIGVSRSYCSLKAVSIAYKEALEALKYRMNLGEESILFLEEVQPEHNPQLSYPMELEQKLVDAIKVTDDVRIDELLRQYIDSIFSLRLTDQEYRMFLVRMLMELLRIVQDVGVPIHNMFQGEQSLINDLLQLRTADEIESWLKHSIILPIVQMLEQRRQSQYRNISEEIIGMIEREYDTDLTLELCAGRMNFSPNYITKVFRKDTGISFTEYLLDYRMKMAKKWLVDTDMKISDIAKKLKYNSSANFIRSFRKIDGMTPGQYRENYWRQVKITDGGK